MKPTQTDRLKWMAIVAMALIGFFSLTLTAQEKDAVKSKLDAIKGKVDKITIKADGKDVTFEGKEAQKLFGKLKSEKRIKFFTADDGNMDEMESGNTFFYKMRKGEGEANIKKKIQVEDKDGKKKVTVTTTKDGKEEVKVYEGAKADEILKEEKEGKELTFTVSGDKGEGNVNIKKKVQVEDKDGKKKVTVTTTKDGKDEVKVYEGSEADEFLVQEKGAKKITFKIDDDMDGNNMIFMKTPMGGGCNCCCCGGGQMNMKMKHQMPGKMMKKLKVIEEDGDKDKSEKSEKK